MGNPPIFARTEVTIKVEEPFTDPWQLVLRRPGHPPYHAECLVVMCETPDGDPHIHVVWRGTPPPEIRELLSGAVTEYLADALPPDHDLKRLPDAN